MKKLEGFSFISFGKLKSMKREEVKKLKGNHKILKAFKLSQIANSSLLNKITILGEKDG
ncbi:hypothetical protein KQI89_06135 [Clostridium sp. MSJ-4]|uniref:Uncharacterized protein n=1 Tax=Clostridium simiarum TaxID=2841506 RepID=A0ABS6EYP0_9CLOT|nr:hypothetical protein [Clostridium simiarum]MBU5591334.1 hypothetical protein [Clostridium simiarum]